MRLILLLVPIVLTAQPTRMRVTGVTATQAVIEYIAPSSSDCTIEVSESPSYSPVVNDVNGSLFSGANSDARFTSERSADGLTRRFVVGTRTSGLSGTTFYSRALQQNTQHYYRLTCGSSVSGVFTTATVPWGDLSIQAPPFNSSGFGNYAWPTIDWTNKTQWYIDPMSGLAYKPAVYPGEYGNTYPNSGSFLFGSDFVTDPSSGWTNDSNVRSGSAASVATTSGTNPIYVGIDPTVTLPGLVNMTGTDNKPISVDDIGVNVFGSGTDGTSTNRQVNLCWSLDWSTCYTSTVTVTLPSGSDASVGTFPASYPTAFFVGWGKVLTRKDLGRTGTVNVSGTAVTLTSTVSGDTAFNPAWVSGTRVWISGSSGTCANNLCTVASVQGPSAMTISESLTLTGSTYKQAPALRIVKTNATGSVNVSVSHIVAVSNNATHPPGGSFELCSQVKVSFSVDRDGTASASKAGRMCGIESWQSGSGAIYWVADDGETRIISVFRIPSTASGTADARDYPNTALAYPFGVAFDPSIATRWYTVTQCANSGTGARCIYRLDYSGDGREWRPSPRYPTGNGAQPSSPSDNVTWTILTKVSTSNDVQAQVDTSCPTYSKTIWGDLKNTIQGWNLAGNYISLVKNGYDVTETPATWIFTFDLNGQFVRCWNSYTGTLSGHFRFAAGHASLSIGGPINPYYFQAFNLNRVVYGAYTSSISHVKKSGSYNTNTSLPASYDGTYDGACPVNSYGATGNNCAFIKIASEPCKTANLTNEATNWPCPTDGAKATNTGQSIALGDYLYDNASYDNTERFQVIEKTVNSSTDIDLTLKRDAIPASVDPLCVGSRVHTNGWTLAMNFGGGRTCNVSSLVINLQTGAVNASPVSDHFDFGIGARWVSASRAYPAGTTVSQLDSTYPSLVMADNPAFAGAATNGTPAMQSYPSARQWTAPASESEWTLNQRHLTQWGFQTLTNVTGNLYRLATLGTADVKRTPWIVTAGGNLLQDISSGSTGDTIASSDTWKFCYAYRNDECRTGSTAGQLYLVVPGPLTTNVLCNEGVIGFDSPCAFAGVPLGGWGIQEISTRQNGDGRWVRRLTMQPGPQRQATFENWRSLPDGVMALWRSVLTDGLYSTMMLAKLPPMQTDTINRTTWRRLAITIPSGTIANNALIRFWYAESGYCTSRLEACYATAATVTDSSAFLFSHELVSGSGVSCASGCTVTVPAQPGRVLFYEFVNNASGTLTTVLNSRRVVAVP